MKCPNCDNQTGIYQEIEDFNPGSGEWRYYVVWHCDACYHRVCQWDSEFEWEDD